MELKDHKASEETQQWFEELKIKYPKVFSLNNEEIGYIQLVTMDIDTGDSPQVCQNLYTLPLKHYSWESTEPSQAQCSRKLTESTVSRVLSGIRMDNAQPNINTSDCKPSTEKLIQQATTIRKPTPVRLVSQPASHCCAFIPRASLTSNGETSDTASTSGTSTSR